MFHTHNKRFRLAPRQLARGGASRLLLLVALTSTAFGVKPLQRQLASQFTLRGIEQLEVGEFGEGLAFLAHALRLDPQQRDAHCRLQSYLT